MTDSTTVSKGLEGVVAASTHLSDVRGEIGQLIYRGFDINELAGKVSFEEVIHLLHFGRLPNPKELADLKANLASKRALPKGVIEMMKGFPKETPPMHVIRTAISALGCFDEERDADTAEKRQEICFRVIAQTPVVTACFHRIREGREPIESDPSLGEAANFLYLLNGQRPEKEQADTLDLCYVLHADHGMNASTFSARVTIATLSDIYSAITTAIGTLKGPLHGGANEAVLKMLHEVGSPENVDAYIDDCLAKKKKIMGIGHRIYKTLDPRAPHLRKMAHILSDKLGEKKWIEMSDRIAEIMLEKKNLHANVDFFSATVYYMLGVPTDLFTPIFAIARNAGWTAHVQEQLGDNRLIRPQSVYEGPEGLKVTPIEQRP